MSARTPQFEQTTPTLRATELSTTSARSSLRSSSQDIPGAFPQSETPRPEIAPATAAAGVGAAGVVAGGAAALLAGHESEKNQELEKKSDNLDTNFDQYFGGPVHSRSPSQKAAEFDSAFANFDQPTTNGTASKSNEFPPIRELEDDDTDNSSEAPTGFDDHFTPASPPRPPKEKGSDRGSPEIASAVPASLQARPLFNTVPSTNSSLPEIEAQTSPPTYGESVPHENPDQFPPEFKGLLPHRGDPTSPPNEPPHSVEHGTGLPAGRSLSQPYAPEAARSPPYATTGAALSTATPQQSTVIDDDFDAAFANMTPAPVVDEDDENDFGTTFANNHATEFDPTFDSPAPSKSTTTTMPAPMATSSHFSTTAEPTSTRDMGATNDYHNFSSNVNNSQPVAPLGQLAPPSTTFKDSDWDDMFASLENPKSATPPPSSNSNPPTTTEAIFAPPPGPPPSQKIGMASTSANEIPTSDSPSPPTPPQKQDDGKPQRPVPGRALTTGTEHDDPILKRLTAMGFSREESLNALEEYDYNIDKVS
jgi:epidermal growth factor receptor substrate 15